MTAPELSTDLTKRLGCRHPIISAGMGGPARSGLAAAVSEAGGFGLLGMVRESPDLIEREIAAVRNATSRAFGVNLIPFATPRDQLEDELAVCFNARVPAMCYFWDVYPDIIERTKKTGAMVLYQVGSVADAKLAEKAGADVIIVQGVEAGGHVKATQPLATLLPRVAEAVQIPVAASGGISGGHGLAAALAMGADGVHCGTAFLASTESFAHDYHKQRLIAAQPDETVLTDLFCINWPPNAPVRVLKNSVVAEAGDKLWGYHPDNMPHVVIGDEEGRAIVKYGTNSPLQSMTGNFEQMALYAGQGAGSERRIRPAAEILAEMVSGAVTALRRLNGLVSSMTPADAQADWPGIRAWRKAARNHILAARTALPPTLRQGMTAALMERLHPILKDAEPPISFYWPFRGEPDLRPLMRALAADGIELALPVGKKLGEPLTFRPWSPGCDMARGVWDIPIPATDLEILPRTILAPFVGFDAALYRLGYGGGFFDRTLATLTQPEDVIGIGYAMFELPSIRPQPHDIPMWRIVTERSAALDVGTRSASPVCYADESEARYAGVLDSEDLAEALAPLAHALPPERKPVLDFIHWRLGILPGHDDVPAPKDLGTYLGTIIPRVRDNGLHFALKAIRAALTP